MKNFLKPSLEKILLFILFMGGINLYVILAYTYVGYMNNPIFDGVSLIGKPLGFYPIGSIYAWNPAIDYSLQNPSYLYSHIIWNFLLDLIFWYLISALVIWTYRYFKSE